MSDTPVHRYPVRLHWSGSTAGGFESYDRAHDVRLGAVAVRPTDDGGLRVTADPAFRGDPSLVNPELLLVAAAVSCQLLSFLAVAARARMDVRAYEDDALGVMPEDDRPVRITTITLRPTVTVAGDVDVARVEHLLEVAHRQCFIANSLSATVVVEPTVVVVPT